MQKPESARSLWTKFYSIFAILGLVNIGLAFGFFTFSSSNLIQERASEQMASVRTSAAQKISLYLTHLKALSLQASQGEKIDPMVQESLHDVHRVKAQDSGNLSFIPSPTAAFQLNVTVGPTTHVWTFTNKGLNRILSQRVGLGDTGEVYVVGEDKKIKSVSRLLGNESTPFIDNESVRRGLRGEEGVLTVLDYRGVEVLSAYSPFHFDGLRYVLLSEIDVAEVFRPMNQVFPRVFLLCGILLLVSLAVAFVFSKKVADLIESMRQQINSFNLRIITTQEEEKRRLSINLHDGIGQTLSALKWRLTQLPPESQGELLSLCNESISEIRSVSNDLMPSGMAELGTFMAIKDYLSKQEKYLNIKIDFWYSEQLDQLTIKEGLAVNIYRMVQELVQNAFKHSGAAYLSVVILKQDDDLLLRFEDNGRGMDPQLPMPRTVKYRTELMDGKLERRYDGKKLVFEVSIPLRSFFV